MGSIETVKEDRWMSTNPFFLTEQKTKAQTQYLLYISSHPHAQREHYYIQTNTNSPKTKR